MPKPSVAILMCTYNGARFLKEQLASFETQDHQELALWVSDDGSRDDTLSLLEQHRQSSRIDPFTVVRGPSNGFSANFLSLLYRPEIQADFYAFSDQDDVWDSDKVSRALTALGKIDDDVPAVYFSRTRLVDANLQSIGMSPLCAREPGFRNALVQSLAGANTLVLNQAARDLLRRANIPSVVSHDWWIYLVISGAGGEVIYDPDASLSYRQHESNVIGSSSGIWAALTRIAMLLSGRYKAWNEQNIRDLSQCADLLTPENQQLLTAFAEMRQAWVFSRVLTFWRLRLYRQSLTGTVAVACATFLRRL